MIGTAFTFCYLTFKKPTPISVEILLVQNNKNQLTIDPKSLIELKNIINENMIVKDQNKLLEIFNQEKSNYVNLITVISILLTVFTLFTALTSFIEKSDVVKLKDEMNKKILEYNKELKNINFNTLISFINKIKERYSSGKDISFEDGKKVTDFATMIKAVNTDLDGIFKYILNKDLKDKIDEKSFFVEYLNAGTNMIGYAHAKGFITDKELNMNTNQLFLLIITRLHSNLDRDKYIEFKKFADTFLTINWGGH